MNYFTADVANLDSATRDYLAEVAREKGRGAPGVFVAGRTNAWPVLSLIVGGIVLLVGLILAMQSLKAPWATAMLVTAIVLLGGWMVLYPFRRWFGGGFGTFQYFDPNHIFESSGRDVTVTNLSELSNLNVVEHFNDGSYQHTNLTFRLPRQARTIAVMGRNKAELVANFYGNVLGLRAEEAIDDAAVLGATAKYMAKEGERPSDAKVLDLTIHVVPEAAAASRKAGFALRFLMIVGAAAAIFCASWLLLSPIQDDMVFEEAKQHGVQGYRDYLLDDRHTRHRDEAKEEIAKLYQPLIAKAAACTDANEKKGWTEMLESLSQFEGLPVVSILVTEKGTTPPPTPELVDRQKKMQTWIADSVGSHFGPMYIAFVQAPDGVKPHLEVTYERDPTKGTLTWQTHFRRTPESDPVSGPEHVVNDFDPVAFPFPSAAFHQAFFEKTFAATVPPIHAAPVSGGDFE